MVDRHYVAAAFRDREYALEFGAHRFLAERHYHFVVSAHHQKIGVELAYLDDVYARLTFERIDSLDSGFLHPRDHRRDVAVRVDHHFGVALLYHTAQLAVVGSDELGEQLVRQHRTVIIRHILGKSDHLRLEYLVKRVDRADVEVAEVAVHPVHQLGIIVEGVQVRLDSEQRARIPEEAVQPDAQREVAALIRLGERLYRFDEALDDLVRVGGLAYFSVVVLVFNRSVAVYRRART